MKNLCSYCGRQSGTNAAFPIKKISGVWKSVICPKCSSVDYIKLLSGQRQLFFPI